MSSITKEKKNKKRYSYFTTIISKNDIAHILSYCKDEYFISLIDSNILLHRFEGDCDIIYYETPKNLQQLIIYRRKCSSLRNEDKIELIKKDLPHIPLLEFEEKLNYLSLAYNLITQIKPLISLSNLSYLSLYHNQIKEIDNLQSLKNLHTLILGKNLIENITGLERLINIEILDLHMNQIKKIENLTHLTKLKRLNLANNQITKIDELVSNHELEELNVRKNLIEKLPDLTHHWKKMKTINLGNNKLVHINALLEIKKLNPAIEVFLENNLVVLHKNCSDILKNFKKLRIILEDNEIISTYVPNLNQNECFIKKDGKNIIGLSNEVFALNKLQGSHIQVPIPKILFSNDCYIIESFIKGKKPIHSQLTALAEELGRYIKLIHSVSLAGFGELTIFKEGAEDNEKEYVDSLINVYNDSFFKANEYLKEFDILKIIMPYKELFNNNKSVLLHGNLRYENVLCFENKISGIINFEQTLIGVPEYDLGFFYLHIEELIIWENFVKGYGEGFNMKKIYLYAVIIGIKLLLNQSTLTTTSISNKLLLRFKESIDCLQLL